MAGFLGHAGVEDHLEQQVSQFIPQILQVAALNGIGDLIGFFDRVGRYGAEVLLDIPGAAGLRVPEASHDREKAAQLFG